MVGSSVPYAELRRRQALLQVEIARLRTDFTQQLDALPAQTERLTAALQDTEGPPKGNKGPKLGGRKAFQPRESVLSVMMRDENYQTIYHVAVAIVAWSVVRVIIEDTGIRSTVLDLGLLSRAFLRLDSALCIWCVLAAVSFFVLPIAHIVVSADSADSEPRQNRKLLGLALYAMLQASCFALAFRATMCPLSPMWPWPLFNLWYWQVPRMGIASKLVVLAEHTRLSMKMHAYFREKVLNTSRSSKHRSQSPTYTIAPPAAFWFAEKGTNKADQPVHYRSLEMRRYAYFLFAPTLVYRDTYPSTGRVRVSFVLRRLCEVLGVVLWWFITFRAITPAFARTVEQPGDWRAFVFSVFSAMLPGMLFLVTAFFLILHSWQNLFAEITGFADRQFYGDWWNARNWSTYYRKWNGVVGDWIRNYVYLDLVELAHIRRGPALLIAFFFSAVVHEYIVACAMGFFYPVLFIMFGGPGVGFIFLTNTNRFGQFWNIFMWLMLSVGMALLLVLYAREFYAREAMPEPLDGWQAVVPRSWYPLFRNVTTIATHDAATMATAAVAESSADALNYDDL